MELAKTSPEGEIQKENIGEVEKNEIENIDWLYVEYLNFVIFMRYCLAKIKWIEKENKTEDEIKCKAKTKSKTKGKAKLKGRDKWIEKNENKDEKENQTIMKILVDMLVTYKINANAKDLLKTFLYGNCASSLTDSQIKDTQLDLNALLDNKILYKEVIDKYAKMLEEFANEVRLDMKISKSIDQSFDSIKGDYITDLELTWLQDDRNVRLYYNMIINLKMILKEMVLHPQKCIIFT